MTKKILFLLIVAFLGACRKSGKGYVDGYAYIEGYNTPVANTKIELWRRDRDDREVMLQSEITDDEGYFSFNFKKQRNNYYFLSLNQYKGFPNYMTLDEKISQVFFPVKPVTIIKCKLKNKQQVGVYVSLQAAPYVVYYPWVKKGDSTTVFFEGYGYGTNTFSWYWFPDNKKINSDTVKETYSLFTQTDTVYRTIEIVK